MQQFWRHVAIGGVLGFSLVTAGCGDRAFGFIQDVDGNFVSQSPENIARIYPANLAKRIAEDLGRDDVSVSVVFADNPVYINADDGSRRSGWLWIESTTAEVVVTGLTADAPELDAAEVERIDDSFGGWFRGKRYHVRVTCERTIRFAAYDPAAAVAPAVAVAPDTPSDSPAVAPVAATATGPVVVAQPTVPTTVAQPRLRRTYVVMDGDTLADISTVFFGTPQYWRRILEANPGLTPDSLQPGQQLVIPVLER